MLLDHRLRVAFPSLRLGKLAGRVRHGAGGGGIIDDALDSRDQIFDEQRRLFRLDEDAHFGRQAGAGVDPDSDDRQSMAQPLHESGPGGFPEARVKHHTGLMIDGVHFFVGLHTQQLQPGMRRQRRAQSARIGINA